MSGTLKWKQPKLAADWERTHVAAGRRVPPALQALALAALFGLYMFLTKHSVVAIHFILMFGVLDLAFPAFSRWRKRRSGTTYVVGPIGLSIPQPMIVARWRWPTIEAYALTDHPDLPGLRCLAFRARRSMAWNLWFFDPFEVSESDLRAILEEHLPGKLVDSIPTAD